VLLLAVGLGALVASGSSGRILLTVGFPVWCFLAYRYPMVGIAVLAAGQFLLRSLVGGVVVLSRGSTSGSTVVIGAMLLLPLVLAALTKGDLGRVRMVFQENRLVMWPLLIMSAAILIGYYLGPTHYGQLKLIAYVGLNLPLLVLPLFLIRTESDARQLVVAIVVVSSFTMAASLIGSSPVWTQSALRGTNTAVGQIADQNVDVGTWFARRVGIGGLAAIAVLLATRARRPYLYWGAAAILFTGVGLAASRGPVLGCVLALLFMLAIPRRIQARRGVRLAIASVVVIAALGVLTYLPSQFANRYSTTFSFSDSSLQARFSDLQLSERLIKQAPLTGVGLGHYPIAIWGADRVVYPHSIVLEFATELGIPIAIVLLLMVGGTVRSALVGLWRSKRPWVRALALCAIGMLVLSFVDAQLSGDLRTNEHIWMAAGLAVAAGHLGRHPQRSAPPTPTPTERRLAMAGQP